MSPVYVCLVVFGERFMEIPMDDGLNAFWIKPKIALTLLVQL
jgi:hypothetical protein